MTERMTTQGIRSKGDLINTTRTRSSINTRPQEEPTAWATNASEALRIVYPRHKENRPEKPYLSRMEKIGAVALTLTATVAGLLTFNVLGNHKTDAEIYADSILPGATGISICDGARLRDDPNVQNSPDGPGEIVLEFNTGNAPGQCFTVSAEGTNVYLHEDSDNGNWYGLPESFFANQLQNSELSTEKTDNILWVNSQTSSPVYTSKETGDGIITTSHFTNNT